MTTKLQKKITTLNITVYRTHKIEHNGLNSAGLPYHSGVPHVSAFVLLLFFLHINNLLLILRTFCNKQHTEVTIIHHSRFISTV